MPPQSGLGDLAPAVERRLSEWRRERFSQRLFDRDTSLWPPESASLTARRLGWLDLPGESRSVAAELTRLAAELRSEGFRQVVLLGMGGSGLAADVFVRVLAPPASGVDVRLLDTTHPDAVRRVASKVSIERTLFVVASKSGGTVETLSLYRYFWSRCEGRGEQFVAITDQGSSLDRLARERGFRGVLHPPPDVGGRYSALSAFGLMPASAGGVDLDRLLESAGAMERACREPSGSPGLELGAAMTEAYLAGRDKLTLLTHADLAPFADWADQLTAESLGKAGRALVPVIHEPVADPTGYPDDRLFVCLDLVGNRSAALSELTTALVAHGHPVLCRELAGPYEIAGEMYCWMVAVAATASAIGVEPFDQPDVEAAKKLARESIERAGGADTGSTVPVHHISSDSGLEPLDQWLEHVPAGGYLGVQLFLPPSDETERQMRQLQSLLRERTGTAVTAALGPRYLHSTGQMHKGGGERAAFLQILDEPEADVRVPETDYSFGALIRAQADGDAAALAQLGRQVLRLSLPATGHTGLSRLISRLERTR